MAEYTKCPENYIFGLDIGTRSIVGTVGYRESEKEFRVVAQVVKMHESRSMLDGQIHDIAKVAETISFVKSELEEMLQYKLEAVCIAAAGRVLKTINVKADLDFGEERLVDAECLHSLELAGMELAYTELKNGMSKDVNMYCVGSTVVHYYLDDFIMLNLEGHKGTKISADFLATFLPDEVIASLYAAVEKAGLRVANLTLEPIAASEVAIPVNFRLLNIALVDVGAGTSDISITKDGSIIGYGMIPVAGDAFTEEIAKKYLVDFATAEKIKIGCTTKKKIDYKDIMGISHKTPVNEIIEGLEDTIRSTTKKIADEIIKRNGGSAVSAVFIVGGGGKIPNFAAYLAEALELPKERVAVRGQEVFANIHFEQEDIKLDSTLVTPVGICLSYYSKNNNFIMLSVNGRQIKLYDNNRLTVMDAAVQIGFPKENLFPKRGKEIVYTVNNETRVIRGEAGEGAKITVNGKAASFNSRIGSDDVIEIVPSTAGRDAKGTVGEIPEYKRKGKLSVLINEKSVSCPRMVRINGTVALENSEVVEGDKIEILDYYVMEEILELMDMPAPTYFLINGKEASWEDRIYDGFEVDCVWENGEDTTKEKVEQMLQIVTTETELKTEPPLEGGKSEDRKLVQENEKTEYTEKSEEQTVQQDSGVSTEIHDITVLVNDTSVVLSGKAEYLFVDVLDFYPFDTSVANGSQVIMQVNGLSKTFSDPIQDGDRIDLYWE